MKTINRRDFEIEIENGITVINCIIQNDEACITCTEQLDELSKKIQDVKFCKYDVMMDIDINEKYQITYPPYILIFQDGKLINKFVYKNISDFEKKLDINSLIKKEKTDE
jgi:thiol-disulfide isomerase/thioredoxin